MLFTVPKFNYERVSDLVTGIFYKYDNNNMDPNEGSGIDWNIFNESEDDTLCWLLHSNTNPNMTALDTVQEPIILGETEQITQQTDILPLDDIALDEQDETQILNFLPSNDTSSRGNADILSFSDNSSSFIRPLVNQSASTPTNKYTTTPIQSQTYVELNTDVSKYSPANATQWPRQTSFNNNNSKRPLKRKMRSISRSSSSELNNEIIKQDIKQQQRREKNLLSVREFRKRKSMQLEANEDRLRRLEAENMDLKMRLKIGKEAILREQQEKQQIKEQMREMLQRNASETEVATFLNMYKVTYSDYGPKRQEKLEFHLSRIRELLLPTQVTKLCLYSVEQGNDMIARDHSLKEESDPVIEQNMSLW